MKPLWGFNAPLLSFASSPPSSLPPVFSLPASSPISHSTERCGAFLFLGYCGAAWWLERRRAGDLWTGRIIGTLSIAFPLWAKRVPVDRRAELWSRCGRPISDSVFSSEKKSICCALHADVCILVNLWTVNGETKPDWLIWLLVSMWWCICHFTWLLIDIGK